MYTTGYWSLNKRFLSFLSTLGRLIHPALSTSWNFPCTEHDLSGSSQVIKATKAAAMKTSVPKECPQSWPCDEEYSRQPALSSRGGQGAPPFSGSCCTERLRTRVVGWHWPAQPLQGLHSPTKQGRAGKTERQDADLSKPSRPSCSAHANSSLSSLCKHHKLSHDLYLETQLRSPPTLIVNW